MSEKMNEDISISESSKILGVSKATISNWIKSGLLLKSVGGVDKDSLLEVKKGIKSGTIKRLNRRANKGGVNLSFIPDEHFRSTGERDRVLDLLNSLKLLKLPLEKTLIILAINLLLKKGEIEPFETTIEVDGLLFKREAVKRVILRWCKRLKLNNIPLVLILDIEVDDLLGVVYQSMLREGDKSKMGSYFTPTKIIDSIVERSDSEELSWLDPCCGTGQFLLKFTQYCKDPQKIFGFDIDPISIEIAKINLLLHYKDQEFTPQIFKINSLIDIDLKRFGNLFDRIATNPPWGARYDHKTRSRLKEIYPEISSKESFSYFLILSHRLLKSGGEVSILLPQSITNIGNHQDIRSFIMDNYSILSYRSFGRCFTKVFSSVISLTLKSEGQSVKTKVIADDDICEIDSSRFRKNPKLIFDFNLTNSEREILRRLDDRGRVSLKGNAKWGLGVVTGDNSKFIYETDEDGREPIFRGSDVNPYLLGEPQRFIHFEPKDYQQVADSSLYRADEKLVYKFISNRLVFAYDSSGSITLNSCNILIPDSTNLDIKVVLALFNSKLFNYYFNKRFNTMKVLRKDLEEFPIPVFDLHLREELKLLIDQALMGEDVTEKIDEKLYQYYGLSNDQIELVEAH